MIKTTFVSLCLLASFSLFGQTTDPAKSKDSRFTHKSKSVPASVSPKRETKLSSSSPTMEPKKSESSVKTPLKTTK